MERNEQGGWVAVPQNQPGRDANDQIVARVDNAADQRQPQLINPEQNAVGGQRNATSKTYDLFILKRWKIETTIDRVQICLWALILLMKSISILAAFSFWVATLLCLKSLPGWEGAQRAIEGYVRRREFAINQIPENDHIWADLFPIQAQQQSYQLEFGFYNNAFAQNALINAAIPILIGDPIVCSILMLFAFLTNRVVTFIHDCLQQANHATRTLAKRRRSS